MRLYNEVNKLINIAEGTRKKFQMERRWIYQARRTLKGAMHVDLLNRWDDDGAHEDFDYDDDPYTPGEFRTMREKLSGSTRHFTFYAALDRKNLMSETKDRLIKLEKNKRKSGSDDDADRLVSMITQIEQMEV